MVCQWRIWRDDAKTATLHMEPLYIWKIMSKVKIWKNDFMSDTLPAGKYQ